jgi:superfamily II DNA or RNA helicase|tara:strand:+ start:251 stop:2572 length:2322 start_codon:yes stop_codon:yes gene_type:complete
MESKLIDIPKNELDEIINQKIEQSEKVLIVVSFIFEAGLRLILNKLKKFNNPSNITIITSNYLKSTEPKALRKLLDLKSLGAKIYLFDSISSGENFHIKSYYFENEKNNFFSCIIGSSNMSFNAFKLSHELNIEIKDKKICKEHKDKMSNFLSHTNLLEISEEVISDYEKIYEENNNLMLEFESKKSDSFNEINFKEPNEVQVEALKALNKSRNEGNKDKGLVVMATGMGKTILSALDVKKLNPKKILFVAHRDLIIKKSKETFEYFMPNKKYGFYMGKDKNEKKDFIFASIQTLGKKNQLERFKKDNFDYIIVDEFHHVGAKSYKALVNYFKPKFFLGLTATPNRTDNIDIMKFCGENLIYEKGLIDGVNLKILCNFDYKGINDKYVDYTKITWKGKKFDEIELEKQLNKPKRATYVYENWLEHKQARTLAFCASIDHCEYMKGFFIDKGIRAVSVHSQSETNRTLAIKMLNENKIDIIFSVDLFNEGVDIPAIDTILMLRPTESKIIFIQQFGRGLRKAESYGKKFVRVIDFIGNHKSFLEKPAALFNFDINANSLGKFVENYKNNRLNLPDESRAFYDVETIDFFTKLSLKIKKEDFLKHKPGNIKEPLPSQIHKGFRKIKVQEIFRYPERGYLWSNMIGHIRPKNKKDEYAKEQFIFITLQKGNVSKDLQYNDFFKTDKLFHWQSEKGTREDNHHGLAVINHKKNNSDIHLFVRSSYAAAKEFAYCGKINFLNGKGSGPFDVDFQLETPLTGDIKEEFLRISKLITKDK